MSTVCAALRLATSGGARLGGVHHASPTGGRVAGSSPGSGCLSMCVFPVIFLLASSESEIAYNSKCIELEKNRKKNDFKLALFGPVW